MGPNERKLVTKRMMSRISLTGRKGKDFVHRLETLTDPQGENAKEAMEWVSVAMEAIKAAPDNPYETDEEIAGAILKKM